MSTYLELCQKFHREVGLTGSAMSTVVSQTGKALLVVDWIADADQYIQALYSDWGFLWTQHSVATIADTAEYTAPSNFGSWDLDSFYLDYTTNSYQHLEQYDYKSWRDEMGMGVQTSDKPSYVIIKPDKNIILHSVPDGIYTLTADYWKSSTRLSGNTDTSNIPTDYERIIIARAKMYYGEYDDAPEVYSAGEKEYLELLGRLQGAYMPGQEASRRGDSSDLNLGVVVE